MNSGSLDQWLEKLETLHPSEIELGLERVARVAGAMDLLHPAAPVVSVAGTNGKGSTVAVLEALLIRCGIRVGAYTSPHFLRFNERIRVNGVPAPDSEIVEAFEEVEAARGETSLTYFEFATLAALSVFRTHRCDVLLLEVGLGGRLDAVNILDATVAVITSISLDHQQWLGDTRGQIGCEKAGIARAGCPVVIADPDPPAAMLNKVVEAGAEPILRLGVDYHVVTEGEKAWHARLRCEREGERRLPEMNASGLLPENIAAAAQAALLLGVAFTDTMVVSAVQDGGLTGRRQHRRARSQSIPVALVVRRASTVRVSLRASSQIRLASSSHGVPGNPGDFLGTAANHPAGAAGVTYVVPGEASPPGRGARSPR